MRLTTFCRFEKHPCCTEVTVEADAIGLRAIDSYRKNGLETERKKYTLKPYLFLLSFRIDGSAIEIIK